MNDAETTSLTYTRRLYDNVLGWYHSAETKAQVVLTIDGIFVGFLANAVFKSPRELSGIVASLPTAAWVSLGLMLAALCGSMISAVMCLRSRIFSGTELSDAIKNAGRKRARQDRLAPEVAWFFQHIAAADPEELRTTLAVVDTDFELSAMASQIHVLAGNVRAKHRATNWGFGLAIATLMLFLAAAGFYLGQARSATDTTSRSSPRTSAPQLHPETDERRDSVADADRR